MTMEQLKTFLKDYGAAIGPSLGFLLGILALFGKYKIDQWTGSWTLKRQFRAFKKLILTISPPTHYFELEETVRARLESEGKDPYNSPGITPNQVMNYQNFVMFNSRVSAVSTALGTIEPLISESGNAAMIVHCQSIKWRFGHVKERVDKWQKAKNHKISPSDFREMHDAWDRLKNVVRKNNFQYHVPKK